MPTTRVLSLLTACVAQLIVVLDVSVVNVALPSIRTELGLGEGATSWVALAYGLGFAGTLLVGARLADVVGTARLLAWSAGAFTMAGVVGGCATSGAVLIGARAAQGICAAVVSPATFTLLTTTHAEGVDFEREVKPHVPDAWIDESKTKVGYEIPFTRFFYRYTPPRPLAEIEADIKGLEAEIQSMLGEVLV